MDPAAEGIDPMGGPRGATIADRNNRSARNSPASVEIERRRDRQRGDGSHLTPRFHEGEARLMNGERGTPGAPWSDAETARRLRSFPGEA